jgi:tetratricopeptide (TPR) repeat protein
MRRQLLVVVGLLLMVPAAVLAQRGGVGGKVVDDRGEPVGDVEVVARAESDIERPRAVKTKGDGTFLVIGLNPGRYTLSYEKEGHQKMTQEVQVRIGERNRLGDIVLARLPEDYVEPEAQDYFDSGVAATRDGDFQKAVDAFTKVAEMAPDRPEVLYNLGFAYEGLEKVDEAVEQYEKALALRPEYYDPLIALAAIHTERRAWSEAAGAYERAIAIRPQDVTVLFNYGAVSMNAGDMDHAVTAFQRVLELEPERAEAHYQLGMIAVSQARDEDALRHLDTYLSLAPEGAHAAAAKGIVDTLAKQ